MIDWSDRYEIHRSPSQILGAPEADPYLLCCGVLTKDPMIRRSESLGGVQAVSEITFSVCVPALTNDVQCFATGSLAERIGKLKAGQRIRVVGRSHNVTRLVTVQGVGWPDAIL